LGLGALGYFQEAVELAETAFSRVGSIRSLAMLIPLLPQEMRASTFDKALERAHTPVDAHRLAYDVIPYLAHVPAEQQYPRWRNVLHLMGRHSRQDLLLGIRELAPVVVTLGGQEAVSEVRRVIDEIGQWFP